MKLCLPLSSIPDAMPSPKRSSRRVTAIDEAEAPAPPSPPAEAPPADDALILSAEDLERTKTLRQLRDMCAARGLPNTGKKSELVTRLKKA
jgi:hypothetical protein